MDANQPGASVLDDNLPDFTGKVILFYVASAPSALDGGILMRHVEFQRIDGRLFAIGRVPEAEGVDWVANLKASVVWESVTHFLVFDSIQEYERRVRRWRPSLWRRVFARY
jgi:hypothetical protein